MTTYSKNKVKELKLENIMPGNDGLIILFGFKNINRRSRFCQLQAADEFPDTTKEITEEKGYLNRFLMQMKVPVLGGKATKDKY